VREGVGGERKREGKEIGIDEIDGERERGTEREGESDRHR